MWLLRLVGILFHFTWYKNPRSGQLEHEEGVRSAGAEIAETEGLGVTSGRKAGSGLPK
jgi:hypothetical protein